jgi:type I restriction enzyme S subunit
MANKNKNPEVRFKGFTEDWELDSFKNLTTINQGLQIAISNRYTKPIKGSYFYITNEFLKEGSKSEYYILAPSESVICTENDVLMTRTGNTGEVVTNVKGAFHNNFFKIKFDRKQIDKNFLVYFLKLDSTQLLIRKLAGNSTIPDLNHNDFYRIQISFPKPIEQKQIGSFFQNIDSLIIQHQKKYDKLVILKKAMLDKMFPKNGAVVPEIRFKGFTSDWVEKPFGEFALVKRGLTYSPSDVSDKGVKVLRSSNIYEDTFIEKEDDVYVKDEAINIEFVKNKDILITSANGSSRLVGKHAIIEGLNGKAVHGGFMLIVRSKKPYFLNASMSSSWYRKFINVNVSGGNGAIGNLKASDFEEHKILVPNKEDEQQKIGNYFKNLDNQIALHETQLDKLKNIKKACLSKMFVAQD